MDEPKTVAEASGYTKTSTHAEVLDFLKRLRELPHAERLRFRTFGKSVEGRELPLVVAADPKLPEDAGDQVGAAKRTGKLRLLVNANIHGGEVEGKEVVLRLLREIARGGHDGLLAHAVLLLVPIYNADGNDRVDKRHRVSQNGPDGGVGQRPNAGGYDLNRDFVKIDTPECRALLGVIRRWDPHLFMDLHTTNGSHHGYHLTYAPSLSPNADKDLATFVRKELLPRVRKATRDNHGVRTYDYGNFRGRRPENGWVTYDHRPRFGTNYFGLRNRIAVLSEAYSYVSFEDRVRATYAFVLETLAACVRGRERIQELCARADRRLENGEGELRFGYGIRLEDPWQDEVLVGSVRRERVEGAGWRLIASDEYEAREIPVQTAFVATDWDPVPRAWAIPRASDKVVFALLDHGLDVKSLASAATVEVEEFELLEATKSRREFQKHYERSLLGAWMRTRVELPAGTILVSARQRLARVAAQLLEAMSEDSLATWNYFDTDLDAGRYPVLRVVRGAELPFKRVLQAERDGKRARVLK